MFSAMHFTASVLLLYSCIFVHGYDIFREVNIKPDVLRNNLEMFLSPIKKLTGIFPNHEIEIQFDVEKRPQKEILKRRADTNILSPEIISSSTMSNSSPSTSRTSTITADKDNQLVHMKDLKKALEDFGKKYSNMNCNKSPPSNERATQTVQNSNGIRLSSILNLLKNSRQMHQDIPKPNEEELSWLKIRIPS